MSLDALRNALNEIRDKLTVSVSQPKLLKALCRNHNLDLNTDECKDILKKGTEFFNQRLDERVNELIDECKLQEKIDQLAKITAECVSFNEELGVDLGYRFGKPRDEVLPYIKKVQSNYQESLESEYVGLQQELARLQAEYQDKSVQLGERMKQFEARMMS
ncbi:unnamed protein product [Auanema sp. JU1783]|nr:unnamed protein product [Auanema sp. JU1783]